MPEDILSDSGQEDGLFRADVARFLGITTSAVNRLAASDVLSDTE